MLIPVHPPVSLSRNLIIKKKVSAETKLLSNLVTIQIFVLCNCTFNCASRQRNQNLIISQKPETKLKRSH